MTSNRLTLLTCLAATGLGLGWQGVAKAEDAAVADFRQACGRDNVVVKVADGAIVRLDDGVAYASHDMAALRVKGKDVPYLCIRTKPRRSGEQPPTTRIINVLGVPKAGMKATIWVAEAALTAKK